MNHFFPFSRFSLPDNGVQRIVQEVRINLCLQRTQFRPGQVVLVLADLCDQGFQAVCHLVNLFAQVTQFFHVHALHPVTEVPFCDSPDRSFQ